jgi:hypothetical protein
MITWKHVGRGRVALGIALLLLHVGGHAECPTPQPDGTGGVSYMPYEDHGIVCNLLVHTWVSTIWLCVGWAVVLVGLGLSYFVERW